MIDWEMVIAISAVVTILGGVFLWLIRAILDPIKQLIKSNTEAVKQVVEKLDAHEERLQCVETKVAVLADRGERRMNPREEA